MQNIVLEIQYEDKTISANASPMGIFSTTRRKPRSSMTIDDGCKKTGVDIFKDILWIIFLKYSEKI